MRELVRHTATARARFGAGHFTRVAYVSKASDPAGGVSTALYGTSADDGADDRTLNNEFWEARPEFCDARPECGGSPRRGHGGDMPLVDQESLAEEGLIAGGTGLLSLPDVVMGEETSPRSQKTRFAADSTSWDCRWRFSIRARRSETTGGGDLKYTAAGALGRRLGLLTTACLPLLVCRGEPRRSSSGGSSEGLVGNWIGDQVRTASELSA